MQVLGAFGQAPVDVSTTIPIELRQPGCGLVKPRREIATRRMSLSEQLHDTSLTKIAMLINQAEANIFGFNGRLAAELVTVQDKERLKKQSIMKNNQNVPKI